MRGVVFLDAALIRLLCPRCPPEASVVSGAIPTGTRLNAISCRAEWDHKFDSHNGSPESARKRLAPARERVGPGPIKMGYLSTFFRAYFFNV